MLPPRNFDAQGNELAVAKLNFQGNVHARGVWRASIDTGTNSVDVIECYNRYDLTYSCTGVGGNVKFEDHEPMSVAMADDTSTLVVGYPEYVLITPSASPSSTPTVSQAPSKGKQKFPR